MEKLDIIDYSFYNDENEYCVVVSTKKLKKELGANKVFIDTEE